MNSRKLVQPAALTGVGFLYEAGLHMVSIWSTAFRVGHTVIWSMAFGVGHPAIQSTWSIQSRATGYREQGI